LQLNNICRLIFFGCLSHHRSLPFVAITAVNPSLTSNSSSK
jgi:hypothetical protein